MHTHKYTDVAFLCMVNEASKFINRLSAPTPPNQGLSQEEIQQQQEDVNNRERELQDKLYRLRKKKKEEEEDGDSDYRRSRNEDEDEDEQTPYDEHEEERETQDTPKESRFMNKIKDVVHKVDERLDAAGEELEEAAGRAYTRSKQGTKAFIKDTKDDFSKALQQKPTRSRKSQPLVSSAARAASRDFAIRDYERRHTPQTGFTLSDNNPSQNPYIGFSDMAGFGDLDRSAFSLDASQFSFSLIGDSSEFQGAKFANQSHISFNGFDGFSSGKKDSSFGVSYTGEFSFGGGDFEFLPRAPSTPKRTKKRNVNKARKSPRERQFIDRIF